MNEEYSSRKNCTNFIVQFCSSEVLSMVPGVGMCMNTEQPTHKHTLFSDSLLGRKQWLPIRHMRPSHCSQILKVLEDLKVFK